MMLNNTETRTRTRTRRLCGVTTVVALTALATVGSAIATAPSAWAGDGKSALSILSADTNVVININIKRMRKSPAFAELLKAMQQNPEMNEAFIDMRAAGMNPEKDLDTLTVGMVAEPKGEPRDVVVVAEGRFNQKRILAQLKKKKTEFKQKSKAGVTFFEHEDGALAFIGKRIIAAESEVIVGALARSKKRGPSAANSRSVRKLIGRIDSKLDFWFVTDLKKGAKLGIPMADKLRNFVGSVDVQRGLSIRLRAGFSDAVTAKELVTQFEGVKGMLGNAPEAKKAGLDVLINKSVLIADERDAVFSVDLTPEEAKKLKGMADMMGGGAM